MGKKITYLDKVATDLKTDVPSINKTEAQNLNDIKESVNLNVDDIQAISQGTGESYETRALAIATGGADDVPFVVYNEDGFNGQYRFLASDPSGYVLIYLNSPTGEIEEGNNKSVVGGKIWEVKALLGESNLLNNTSSGFLKNNNVVTPNSSWTSQKNIRVSPNMVLKYEGYIGSSDVDISPVLGVKEDGTYIVLLASDVSKTSIITEFITVPDDVLHVSFTTKSSEGSYSLVQMDRETIKGNNYKSSKTTEAINLLPQTQYGLIDKSNNVLANAPEEWVYVKDLNVLGGTYIKYTGYRYSSNTTIAPLLGVSDTGEITTLIDLSTDVNQAPSIIYLKIPDNIVSISACGKLSEGEASLYDYYNTNENAVGIKAENAVLNFKEVFEGDVFTTPLEDTVLKSDNTTESLVGYKTKKDIAVNAGDVFYYNGIPCQTADETGSISVLAKDSEGVYSSLLGATNGNIFKNYIITIPSDVVSISVSTKYSEFFGLFTIKDSRVKEEKYNAFEFGIFPNFENVTLKINQAIEQIESKGGGVLYFPKGDYIIGGDVSNFSLPILCKSNVSLRGSGINETVFFPLGVSTCIKAANTDTDQLFNVHFTDFSIDGINQNNATYTSAIKGFHILYMNNCSFNNIEVRNTFATGFGVDFLNGCKFNNCWAIGNGRGNNGYEPGGAGFGIGTGRISNKRENTSFVNCYAYGNGSYGFFFEAQYNGGLPFGNMLTNCFAEKNRIGFADSGATNAIFNTCTAYDNETAGFAIDKGSLDVDNGEATNFVNCVSSHNGTTLTRTQNPEDYTTETGTGHGILVELPNESSNNICITGVKSTLNKGDGLFISLNTNASLDGLTISGHFTNNDRNGIRILSSGTGVVNNLLLKNLIIKDNGASSEPLTRNGIYVDCPITKSIIDSLLISNNNDKALFLNKTITKSFIDKLIFENNGDDMVDVSKLIDCSYTPPII